METAGRAWRAPFLVASGRHDRPQWNILRETYDLPQWTVKRTEGGAVADPSSQRHRGLAPRLPARGPDDRLGPLREGQGANRRLLVRDPQPGLPGARRNGVRWSRRGGGQG